MAMYKGPNGQMVYAQDIECVVDPVQGKGGIYIGNLQASQNLTTLKKHSIQAILTSAKGVFLDHPKSQIPHHLYIAGEDRDGFDLSKYFDKAAQWIKNRLEQTNILVHCLAGVSRSVSLVIAYLIKHKGMSFDDSFRMLKSRRRIIHPNDGFKNQLREYERSIKTSRSLSPPRHRNLDYGNYSPDRNRYANYSPSKKYEDLRTSYARDRNNYSPTKRYDYKYSDYRQQKPIGYESRVNYHQPESSVKKPLNNFNMDEIDKKIQQRRKSLGLSGRMKSYSQYNPLHSQKQHISGATHNFSDKKPFEVMNDDLDRKIAEIRKKYTDYTDGNMDYPLRKTGNTLSHLRTSNLMSDKAKRYHQQSYSNFNLDLGYNQNQNPEVGGRLPSDLNMRKISSNYEKPVFGQSTVGRPQPYNFESNDYQGYRHRPTTGIQMRKMYSNQQY